MVIHFFLKHNSYCIYDSDGREMAKITMENKSFPLQWQLATVDVLKIMIDETRLWLGYKVTII